MAIIYTTKINILTGAPSLGEFENVITGVEFLIKGEDGDYVGASIGHIKVELDPSNFTPLENILETTVKGWVNSHDCYNTHVAIIERDIQEQKLPTNVTFKTPW
jgi:hypothetical protein